MEDPEIEKIKQRKLVEMLKQQSEVIAEAQASVINLDQVNFSQTILSENLVLVDFGRSGVDHADQCIQFLKEWQKNIDM